LGGGSADAAATIRALEQYWNLAIPGRDNILIKLGADVPVCYHGKTCRFEGIGEKISDFPPLPPLHLAILNPGVHSTTKDVFAKREEGFQSAPVLYPPDFKDLQDLLTFLYATRNDLAHAAEDIHPAIARSRDFMERQKGCLFARMSGSGSSVFGIFDSAKSCADVCATQEWAFVRSVQI